MKAVTGLLAACLLLLIAPARGADRDAIEERIRALVPNIEQLAISETPIDNLLQVMINKEVLYMSDDGRYLVQGRMVDLDTQTDLTEAAKSELRRESLAAISEEDMVIFSPDEPVYDLVVFTDPDCGYCRRLHSQIDDYLDLGIRVHYMAFPRSGVDSETYDKLVSIWCAENRQEAMTIAKSGGQPEPAECPNPIADQYQLGQSLGVTGTPAMMTFNGDMIPGYVPPEDLRDRLEQLTARSDGQ